jgi:hypothetical protein
MPLTQSYVSEYLILCYIKHATRRKKKKKKRKKRRRRKKKKKTANG